MTRRKGEKGGRETERERERERERETQRERERERQTERERDRERRKNASELNFAKISTHKLRNNKTSPLPLFPLFFF